MLAPKADAKDKEHTIEEIDKESNEEKGVTPRRSTRKRKSTEQEWNPKKARVSKDSLDGNEESE